MSNNIDQLIIERDLLRATLNMLYCTKASNNASIKMCKSHIAEIDGIIHPPWWKLPLASEFKIFDGMIMDVQCIEEHHNDCRPCYSEGTDIKFKGDVEICFCLDTEYYDDDPEVSFNGYCSTNEIMSQLQRTLIGLKIACTNANILTLLELVNKCKPSSYYVKDLDQLKPLYKILKK